MTVSRNLFLAALVAVAAPVVASEIPAEEVIVTQVVEATKVVVPGICSKVANGVKSVVAFPFVATAKSANAFVNTCGGMRFANWLAEPKAGKEAGRVVSFFADHKVGTARLVAAVELAAVCAIAYKLYQTYVAQDDVDADEEYDFGVFSDEDFDVTEEDAQ